MAQTTFVGCCGGIVFLVIHSRVNKPIRADSTVMLAILELLNLYLITMAKVSDIPIFLLSRIQIHFLSME
ncbi:hypothetical protein N7508_008340 [Penicillium antarcticum]|uniref:uncharacterized protein n=1 Tax=Penicillium antarcticum TaxID=416450 RepID=UPI00238AD2B2|nr:uncharacterized protein N7508_008340 [Penicillium antarcticum]KAJ5298091.1 hypothetical protein N7508_008340 [Penicillium antarcticum]